MSDPVGVLWEPASDDTSEMARFAEEFCPEGLTDYAGLWRWSVEDLNGFWSAVFAHFTPPHSGSAEPALAHNAMPGAEWFPNLRINYAEVALQLRGRHDDEVIVIARSQSRTEVRLTVAELRDRVARVRAGLRAAGIQSGDRVAAYSPNIPETLVLFLAAASMGATFTSCAPEFGAQSVIDRWKQIEPSLIVTVDGYGYGAKAINRIEVAREIADALPGNPRVVMLPYLNSDAAVPDGWSTWAELTSESEPLEFERVGFAHPLYVLYSSGTTGLPKPIVHGHGGITIEHLKSHGLQHDLGPGDTFFWFSTTGWMMWNFLVSGLLVGSTIVMMDGNPAYPDLCELWRMADELELTYFGTSAPFLLQCRKEGLRPRDTADLSRLRGLGSTGAPLPAEGFRWVYATVSDTVRLESMSGGTDVCTSLVAGAPLLPVYAGELSGRALGAAVDAFGPDGRPVVGETGELVITRPMPSMPVGFWNDSDGERYRQAYFADFEGCWRHGDWITITDRGSCIIQGRSDATLNRGGVRLGTAEFYSLIESLSDVRDSLVVHLEDDQGGAGELLLFVALEDGIDLDAVQPLIVAALRSRLSPRHVPDQIYEVRAVPRTLSGKKLEVPVKRILRGADPAATVARGVLADPDAIDEFSEFRRTSI